MFAIDLYLIDSNCSSVQRLAVCPECSDIRISHFSMLFVGLGLGTGKKAVGRYLRKDFILHNSRFSFFTGRF